MAIEVFATTIITNYHAAADAAVAQQLKLGVSIENKNETHRLTKPSRQFEIKLRFFSVYVCPIVVCCCCCCCVF